ncbi:MAG: leucine-rich repeat protein [Lachnospiraceae bacterium]|nr:leucine-rich repeat protein [Lachnospiraceae bacterium]
MASSTSKKPKLRLKKQVKRTLGGIFLASAVAVAAIPAGSRPGGEVEAANACNGTNINEYSLSMTGTGATTQKPQTKVPYVADTDTQVYSTGGGEFQFVYVNDAGVDNPGEANKFAVIMGFNSGYLEGGTLEIPNTVDVYRQLSDNNLAQGNCLVGKSGNFLYYAESEETTPTFTTTDVTSGSISDLEPFKNYLNIYNDYETTGALHALLLQYDQGYDYMTKTPNRIRIILDSSTENLDPNDETKVISYTYKYKIDHYFYRPCLYSTISAWDNYAADQLYYNDKDDPSDPDDWKLAKDAEYQKVEGIEVRYIGNQYVTYDTSQNDYKIAGDVTSGATGIFAGDKGANIKTLITHENLAGIGDYAFYNCVALGSISFQNGLIAIGNHAFEGCRGLGLVKMPDAPKLQNIGAYAFKDCVSLTGLYIPHSVNLLCDGVFENCTGLTYIDLTGDLCDLEGKPAAAAANVSVGAQSSLSQLGNHIFYGCGALTQVIFPSNLGAGYSPTNIRHLNINMFEDCPNLAKITMLSPYVDFTKDTHDGCKFEVQDDDNNANTVCFHDQLVNPEFYFESIDPPAAIPPSTNIGALHKQCQDTKTGYEFTYKYYGQEMYEVTVTEEGGGKAIYQVDNTNSLTGFVANGTVKSLTFPEHFGPYHIETIPAGRFQDNCTLEKVTLPSTINSIGDAAFKGCHNLTMVRFENDQVQIGTEAFRTQQTLAHKAECPDHLTGSQCPPIKGNDPNDPHYDDPLVPLYFVTTISSDSTPFNYAMSEGGKYNNNLQNESYPILFSGFPNLLEISYNKDKNCAELVNFPTVLSLPSYASASNIYLKDEEKEAINHYLTNNTGTTYDKQLADVLANLTIPKGVKSIQDGLFEKNTNGTSLVKMGVISEGLTEIDVVYTPNTAYNDCNVNTSTGKIDVTFDGIGIVDPTKSDFAGCEGLTNLELRGESKITIPDYAFYDCESLATVTISQQVDSIGEQAFSECDALTAVDLAGVTEIKDHAFLGDDALADVTISADTTTLGYAPFRLCNKLNNVKFAGNPYYTTTNGIIYGTTSDGTKTSIVEVLPGRSSKTLQSSEADLNIKTLAQESFADTGMQIVNLENSNITNVPEYAFDNCNDLVSVYLPSTCSLINKYAFRGSGLSNLTVNDSELDCEDGALNLIEPTYDFTTGTDHGIDSENNVNLTVFAPAETDENGNVTNPSKAYTYFKNRKYLVQALVPVVHYYVTYWDYETATSTKRTLRTTEEYTEGDTVTVIDPLRTTAEGFTFLHYENRDDTDETYAYRDQFVIKSDLVLNAVYEGIKEEVYTASFIDTDPTTGTDNGTLVEGIAVNPTVDESGNSVYAITPALIAGIAPTTAKTGYTFSGWSPLDPRNGKTFTLDQVNVRGNVIEFRAFYKADSSGSGESGSGSGTVTPVDPSKIDYSTDPDVVAGNAFVASYYAPNGIDLITRIKVTKGDKAPKVAYPEAFKKGYQWSPDPLETVMDANHSFYLVASDDADEKDSYTATYYYTDGVTVYQKLEIEKDGTPPNLMMPAGYYQCAWSPDPTSIKMDKDLRFTMVAGANYNPGSGTTGPYYTLTVVNGSGSGSYPAGTQAIIVANEPETGRQFGSWTISPDNTVIASKGLSATVITMPSENVTVTANYIAKTSGGGSSGSGSGSGTGTTPTPSKTSSGTTVVIEKNGLSNTGVVSAVVNGSSDNFTIKITEQSAASEAVLKALQAQFGDVNKIMYFPMDISLYDASGDKKITDTTGLTVTITLPLPDSLIPYGGNNKVAAVVNNQLDILSPKFTTINGVDCVTFTCTHFSPYVIYVNTEQISLAGDNSNGPSDQTPKTGDGIKPKWFLATGLAAIGVFFFVWNDKRRKKVIAK